MERLASWNLEKKIFVFRSEEGNMDATPIQSYQNASTRVVPADHRARLGDGLLPEEALYGRASHAARQPEAALMCAILRDAVESFQEQFVSTATRRARRLGEEAEEWLFSDDSRWLFSFLSVCDALDLRPQYIRRGLKYWQEHGPRKQPANGHSKVSNPSPKSILVSSADRRVHVSVSQVISKRFSFREKLARSQRKSLHKKDRLHPHHHDGF